MRVKSIKFCFPIIILFYLILVSYSIDISSCQTISSAGNYVLTQDLSTTSDCLILNAPGINLDCQNHMISGDQGNGDYGIITNDIADNVVISNCNMQDFDYGLYLEGEGANIENITITSCNSGVYFGSAGSNTLTNIVSTNNVNYGIYFSFANNNILSSIQTSGNGIYGIYNQYGQTNTIKDSVIMDYLRNDNYVNTYTNITYNLDVSNAVNGASLVASGTHYMTSDMTFTGDGFDFPIPNIILDCQGHTITGDQGSGDKGFYTFDNGDSIQLRNCIAEDFDYGLHLEGESGNIENVTINSCNTGVYFGSAGSNTLSGITSTNNVNNGIYFSFSNNNILSQITTSGNGIYGIYNQYGQTNTFSDSAIWDYIRNENYANTYTNITYDLNVSNAVNGASLVASGTHYMTSDLTFTGDGFDFPFSNAILDCQGHTITGDRSPGDIGIYIFENGDNTQIRNCNIINFNHGIYTNGENCDVQNILLSNNNYGIYFNSADSNTFNNITSINNVNSGIYFYFSSSNILSQINTSGNGLYGIFNQYGQTNTISDSVISDYLRNEQYANTYTNITYNLDISNAPLGASLVSTAGTHYMTSDMTFTGDGYDFPSPNIELDCQGHTITGDRSSGDYGLFLFEQGDNAQIRNCNIVNFDRGFFTHGENSFIENITISSSNIGLYVGNADSNVFSKITSTNNTNYGVYFYFAGYNNLSYINTSGNGIYGYYGDYGQDNQLMNSTISDYIRNGNYNSNTYTNITYNLDVSNAVNGASLVASGTHYMTSDMTFTGDAFDFPISDIILDCHNHAITGDGGAGDIGFYFYNNGDDAQISNCVIRNFDNCIETHGNYGIFTNLSMTNCDFGLYLYQGDYNKFQNIIINNSNKNIDLTLAVGNIFCSSSFENLSKITNIGWSTYPNSFNCTIDGNNIGNYWTDLPCSASEMRGDYDVCTTPPSYILGTNNVDNAPLASAYVAPPPPPSEEPPIIEGRSRVDLFPYKMNVKTILLSTLMVFAFLIL